MNEPTVPLRPPVPSGIDGLDSILNGGWPAGQLSLVHGFPGAGKTTLGLQFLLGAAARNEPALYFSLSETREEVELVAHSHGWNLDGITLFTLDTAERALGLEDQQTMFDPADVEFRETSRALLEAIERVKPRRLVFDSLSELALLARDELPFRRELMVLKRRLMALGTTAILMSDRTHPSAERHIHSLAHGVLELDVQAPDYGAPKRQLQITKLRGAEYIGGRHDFRIRRGGIVVYPRLVAAKHGREFTADHISSGSAALDAMLGGGLVRGTSTLLMGPAGTGKSSLVALLVHSCLCRGEAATVFLFDEQSETFLRRSDALGTPLREHIESGLLALRQIDPAEISSGHLVHMVQDDVSQRGVRFVAIDSLNGYIHSMSDESVVLQVHELLSYLARMGVATVVVLTQAGLVGAAVSPADITYVADAVMLTRFFEARGHVRRAISMFKNRGGHHETTIRELRFEDTVEIGEPLTEFQGVLSGTPAFLGQAHDLLGRPTPGSPFEK